MILFGFSNLYLHQIGPRTLVFGTPKFLLYEELLAQTSDLDRTWSQLKRGDATLVLDNSSNDIQRIIEAFAPSLYILKMSLGSAKDITFAVNFSKEPLLQIDLRFDVKKVEGKDDADSEDDVRGVSSNEEFSKEWLQNFSSMFSEDVDPSTPLPDALSIRMDLADSFTRACSEEVQYRLRGVKPEDEFTHEALKPFDTQLLKVISQLKLSMDRERSTVSATLSKSALLRVLLGN